MDKIKILFLSADPSDSARLRLGQESREIRENLQLSKQRDFVLESRESVRPGDITQAIYEVEPRIVHFAGHGRNTGEICFEDALGKTQLVDPAALANLFKVIKVKKQISCVVLNSCYSNTQAEAIAEHVPFVIGMNQAIGDKAAIAFATGFYRALGAGYSFKDAYELGRVEIRLLGIPEHLTPVLHAKTEFSSPDYPETQLNIHSVGQSYLHLQKLLEDDRWGDADVETLHLMLKAYGRAEDDWLRDQELTYMPCEVLCQVDRMWQEHSNNRFGFSIQQEIYRSCKISTDEQSWEEFICRVGWHKKGFLGLQDEYRFPLGAKRYDYDSAPQGYLPWITIWHMGSTSSGLSLTSLSESPYRRFLNLEQRLENCIA